MFHRVGTKQLGIVHLMRQLLARNEPHFMITSVKSIVVPIFYLRKLQHLTKDKEGAIQPWITNIVFRFYDERTR